MKKASDCVESIISMIYARLPNMKDNDMALTAEIVTAEVIDLDSQYLSEVLALLPARRQLDCVAPEGKVGKSDGR